MLWYRLQHIHCCKISKRASRLLGKPHSSFSLHSRIPTVEFSSGSFSYSCFKQISLAQFQQKFLQFINNYSLQIRFRIFCFFIYPKKFKYRRLFHDILCFFNDNALRCKSHYFIFVSAQSYHYIYPSFKTLAI